MKDALRKQKLIPNVVCHTVSVALVKCPTVWSRIFSAFTQAEMCSFLFHLKQTPKETKRPGHLHILITSRAS